MNSTVTSDYQTGCTTKNSGLIPDRWDLLSSEKCPDQLYGQDKPIIPFVLGFFLLAKSQVVNLTTHLHLELRLSMTGLAPFLPL